MTDKEKTAEPLLVPYLDNAFAPEIFSTGSSGHWLHEGVITITFETANIDHTSSPGPARRVVVGRLTMPIGAAQRHCLDLYNFLKQMGHDPLEIARGPNETAQ